MKKTKEERFAEKMLILAVEMRLAVPEVVESITIRWDPDGCPRVSIEGCDESEVG